MEASSEPFKLKIPEFVQPSFALRFLPIITKSVPIVEEIQKFCHTGQLPPKKLVDCSS